MSAGLTKPAALLLGRRTYQDFAGFWPKQSGNPYTEVLNAQQKYVASRTLAEPLPWQNSTLLKGDAADAVGLLKEEPGRRLLPDGAAAALRLTESVPTTTGVIMARYERA